MSERRMMTKKITSSARFIKMPTDSQALYLHLCMNADDDGIVEAYSILKLTGIREDNLRVLASKEFIKVLNEDLVSYIMDWTEQNKIRPDRKINSIYKDLLVSILPDVELVEPAPRIDVKNNSKRLGGGQSTVSPRTDDKKEKSLKKEVDSPRTAEYSIGEYSLVEDNKEKNTISDFSAKNSEVKKILDSEKVNLLLSENNEAIKASPKKRTFKNPNDEIISEIIDAFKPINSLYANCYKRKVEKDAILDLIKVSSKEELLDIITNKLPVTNGEEYAPQIVKPSELANKWAKLQNFLKNNPNLFSETPYSSKINNYSDDSENQNYKLANTKLSELPIEEQKAYLKQQYEFRQRMKKERDTPQKPIDFKSFAEDFKKKPTSSVITKEELAKIPRINY